MAAVTIASEPEALRPRPVTGRCHPPATYRQRRLVVVAGLVVALALLAWTGARGVLGASGGPAVQLVDAHVVVVHPGDTLWSIAVSQDPHGNVLALLDRLETETHDRPLQAGERIVVP